MKFVSPIRRIGAIRDQFTSIQRGDTKKAVESKLVSAVLTTSTLSAPFWDEKRLNEADEKKIRSSIGERIDTFFLPTSFVISFDESGLVIGKHIYD